MLPACSAPRAGQAPLEPQTQESAGPQSQPAATAARRGGGDAAHDESAPRNALPAGGGAGAPACARRAAEGAPAPEAPDSPEPPCERAAAAQGAAGPAPPADSILGSTTDPIVRRVFARLEAGAWAEARSLCELVRARCPAQAEYMLAGCVLLDQADLALAKTRLTQALAMCEEGDPGCEQVHQVLRTLGDAGDVLELSSDDDAMPGAESPPFPSEDWDTENDSSASSAADGAAGG